MRADEEEFKSHIDSDNTLPGPKFCEIFHHEIYALPKTHPHTEEYRLPIPSPPLLFFLIRAPHTLIRRSDAKH